eukprot:scaffold3638_cov60-Phaeocystis_antarctica.AAC.3
MGAFLHAMAHPLDDNEPPRALLVNPVAKLLRQEVPALPPRIVRVLDALLCRGRGLLCAAILAQGRDGIPIAAEAARLAGSLVPNSATMQRVVHRAAIDVTAVARAVPERVVVLTLRRHRARCSIAVHRMQAMGHAVTGGAAAGTGFRIARKPTRVFSGELVGAAVVAVHVNERGVIGAGEPGRRRGWRRLKMELWEGRRVRRAQWAPIHAVRLVLQVGGEHVPVACRVAVAFRQGFPSLVQHLAACLAHHPRVWPFARLHRVQVEHHQYAVVARGRDHPVDEVEVAEVHPLNVVRVEDARIRSHAPRVLASEGLDHCIHRERQAQRVEAMGAEELHAQLDLAFACSSGVARAAL